ncbi:MAG TPA: beta-ribofuranosylaminobenzene 5'-phosphate synthase family protein [Xanthobacteraceae bacterium]|nr:beta-ribofuranosylaminobenzene 5'-phosphate synthase family protein [Xanthobacteraceae bacterium]
MPVHITVTVPARLHLGFLDLNGGLGRRFGSIGLAISNLQTKIALRRASKNEISGPERERVERHIDKMVRRLALSGGHTVNVLDVVPAHSGLGSGTQLALAVAAGIRHLHDLPLDIEGDAIHLGRGARSGVGIGLFHRGGLVVDGGCLENEVPAPIVSHISFPDRWRIVVVLDPTRRGIHGAKEVAAFGSLPPFPDGDAAQLCRLVIMKALPAAAEQDIVSFGSAIKELQARLGDYFAVAQGGMRFTSPDVAAVLAALDREGAFGIGQSSWGPTGFAFAATLEEANRLARIAQRHPSGQGLDIRVCAGFNRAAEIAVHSVGVE